MLYLTLTTGQGWRRDDLSVLKNGEISYKNLDSLLAFPELAAEICHSYMEEVWCPRLGHVPVICHPSPFLSSLPGHFIPSGVWPGLQVFEFTFPEEMGICYKFAITNMMKSMSETLFTHQTFIKHLCPARL